VRIIIGCGRDSKFIIIGGVGSNSVTENKYEDSVAVLECSLLRKYTTALAYTGCFTTFCNNFAVNF
jgi:hypothetical protein